jgi:RNA polymerase sigma-70 factor (ECF subfamily)
MALSGDQGDVVPEDPAAEDREILELLRAGDEEAFAGLCDRFGRSMLRIARLHVRDRAVAEEVVQETWVAVLEGIDRFEGRSSLRTWIFRILSNRAKTRGEREGRTVPFSALISTEAQADAEPSVNPTRFQPAESPNYPYHWASPPRPFTEQAVFERETIRALAAAISRLPQAQQTVIRLRDVEGWSAEEVSELLEVSDGNQRVILHRARSRVRSALEQHLDPTVRSR